MNFPYKILLVCFIIGLFTINTCYSQDDGAGNPNDSKYDKQNGNQNSVSKDQAKDDSFANKKTDVASGDSSKVEGDVPVFVKNNTTIAPVEKAEKKTTTKTAAPLAATITTTQKTPGPTTTTTVEANQVIADPTTTTTTTQKTPGPTTTTTTIKTTQIITDPTTTTTTQMAPGPTTTTTTTTTTQKTPGSTTTTTTTPTTTTLTPTTTTTSTPSPFEETNQYSENIYKNMNTKGEPDTGGGFPIFLMVAVVFVVVAYFVYHNRGKVMGYLVEGKNGGSTGNRRAPGYRRLKNLEEAMPGVRNHNA
eukprot:TCONS_00053471-protein